MAITDRFQSEQHKCSTPRRTREEADDPVMPGFLSFLEMQVSEHPGMITPVNQEQLARIGKMFDGVEFDDARP